MVRNPAPILPWRRPCTGSSRFFAIALCLAAQPARGQPDTDDKTGERAAHIATQPVRDVGIAKDKIPPVLQQALEAPYAVPNGRCRVLTSELVQLDTALGPDFDAMPAKGDDKLTQLAEAGGEMVVNSLIPFRGIVREVSGAAAADRHKRAAVNAGLARRGFLRGLARARHCKLETSPAAPGTAPAPVNPPAK